jgi:hypothetical protein
MIHLNNDTSSSSNEEGGVGCILSTITSPIEDTKDTKLLNWEPPRLCSNAKQMQEMREALLCKKANLSHVESCNTLFTSKRQEKKRK